MNSSKSIKNSNKSTFLPVFGQKTTINHLKSGIICIFLFWAPNINAQTAPDYSNSDHWAALPTKIDLADGVPGEEFKNKQAEAEIDVFFIHPTSYLKGKAWNADVNNAKINKKTDEGAIKHQASVFNGAAKVYAPRYRQAVLRSFYKDIPESRKAVELAYADVETAFEYYLTHYNQGRPFILASHSQGTYHAVRLIKNKIDGTTLQNRLVAAYIPGYGFSSDSFNTIQACADKNQTGCYCAWSTWAEGHRGKFHETFNKHTPTVNPVSWLPTPELPSKEEDHLGVVVGKFEVKYRRSISVTVKDGIIWVTKPDVRGKMFLTKKNWHIADYNMFWLNIRENASHRKKLFWKQ